VVTKYRNSSLYQDCGEIEIEYVQVPNPDKAKPRTVKTRASLVFSRPNFLVLTLGAMRLLCDGKDLVVVIDSTKRYVVRPAPKKIALETFRQEPLGDLLACDSEAMYLAWLLTFNFGHEAPGPVTKIIELPWTVDSDRAVGAKRCTCLTLDSDDLDHLDLLFGQHMTCRLLVDPQTNRLAGMEFEMPAPRFVFSPLPPPPIPGFDGADGAMPAEAMTVGMSMVTCKITWIAGRVSDEKLPSSTFQFLPPRGYKLVARTEDLFQVPAPVEPQPVPLGPEIPAPGPPAANHLRSVPAVRLGLSGRGSQLERGRR
jgi:hypothetical protein